MRKLIYILAIILAIGLPGNLSAQDSKQGVIEGQVVNETEGGGSVAGLEVALIAWIEDGAREIQTSETDGEGKFRFADISVEQSYLVRVCYMQIDYYYPIEFGDEETEKSIEVPVCDTTTSDQAIRVNLCHIVLYAEDGYFSVAQVMWLLNDGDRTYVGSEDTNFEGTQGVLVFTLPEGALEFEVPEEFVADYFMVDDDTVSNTLIFPPGEREIVFSYRFESPASGDLVIELFADYPTDALHIMVQGEDIEVASTRLNPAGPIVTETGEKFIHFTVDGLERGDTVDIHLSSLAGDSSLPFIIIGASAVVVIIVLVTYYMRRRAQAQSLTAPQPPESVDIDNG